jgi:hypothetical protein
MLARNAPNLSGKHDFLLFAFTASFGLCPLSPFAWWTATCPQVVVVVFIIKNKKENKTSRKIK